MTRRGNPEQFTNDPGATTFDVDNLDTGKGLIGGDPQRRAQRTGHHHAPLDGPLLQVADLVEAPYQARLEHFLAQGPLEIEIGFGDGTFLLDRAHKHRAHQFLGFEVRWEGVKPVLDAIQAEALTNILVSADDARYALARALPPACAQVIHVLLPDPWWKRRHQHRRMFTPFTVDLYARTLVIGGLLHVKTDVPAYAELIADVVTASRHFTPHDAALAAQFAGTVPTTREAWCLANGYPVVTFCFQQREA
jgi:tRNA (guanine-N7-)-methyltransferase